MSFAEGGTVLGASAFVGSNGLATLTTSALSAGTHVITATFDGGTFFTPSTSPPLSLVVAKASTRTVLVSANPVWSLGSSLTFTARLTSTPPGSSAPKGTVTFSEGGPRS